MKLSESVIIGIAATICVITCAFVLFKIGILNSDSVNFLSVIGSFLSPLIALIAFVVAVFAYQNQAESNKKNLSKTTLGAILSDINAARNLISLAAIPNSEQPNSIEYGNKAARYFSNKFWIPAHQDYPQGLQQSQINDLSDFPAQDFAAQALVCFDNIVQVVRSINNDATLLEVNDFKKADEAVRFLITTYYRDFDPVFDRIRQALQTSSPEDGDFRSPMIVAFTAIVERYESLRSELIDSHYLEEVFAMPPNMTANRLAQQIANRHIDLRNRIGKLMHKRNFRPL